MFGLLFIKQLISNFKTGIKFRLASEDLKSLKAFIANRIFIENFNKNHKTFKLKTNGKIHFSANEFKNKFLLKSNVTKKIRTKLNQLSQLSQLSMAVKKKSDNWLKVNVPGEIDWVKNGMVTPVRDQKSCGCCYAFSTVI